MTKDMPFEKDRFYQEYDACLAKEKELIKKREKLHEELTPIKKNVILGRNRYTAASLYEADKLKVASIENEIHVINVELQETQRECGRIKKLIGKAMYQKPVGIDRLTKERIFIEVAQETLSPDTFKQIWDTVHVRLVELLNDVEVNTGK